jgi:fluoride ion exporter CrcB/FEX
LQRFGGFCNDLADFATAIWRILQRFGGFCNDYFRILQRNATKVQRSFADSATICNESATIFCGFCNDLQRKCNDYFRILQRNATIWRILQRFGGFCNDLADFSGFCNDLADFGDILPVSAAVSVALSVWL